MTKERIITIYEIPEATSGDPYIRVPREADKAPSTYRIDRETGEVISLWEEKMRYPYKTKVASRLYVKTTERTYEFQLKLEDGAYLWNGSNICRAFWTVLGINQNSPRGLQASKWHDNLLQFKQESFEQARKFNPEITMKEFRSLTTHVYVRLLINNAVNPIKAWFMGMFVNLWQFFNSDWREIKE